MPVRTIYWLALGLFASRKVTMISALTFGVPRTLKRYHPKIFCFCSELVVTDYSFDFTSKPFSNIYSPTSYTGSGRFWHTMEEKERRLPIEELHVTTKLMKRRERTLLVLPGLLLFASTILLLVHINIPHYWKPWFINGHTGIAKSQCPQVKPIFPSIMTEELSLMDEFLQTPQFRNESIARLSGAVKIPSISYDDLGPI